MTAARLLGRQAGNIRAELELERLRMQREAARNAALAGAAQQAVSTIPAALGGLRDLYGEVETRKRREQQDAIAADERRRRQQSEDVAAERASKSWDQKQADRQREAERLKAERGRDEAAWRQKQEDAKSRRSAEGFERYRSELTAAVPRLQQSPEYTDYVVAELAKRHGKSEDAIRNDLDLEFGLANRPPEVDPLTAARVETEASKAEKNRALASKARRIPKPDAPSAERPKREMSDAMARETATKIERIDNAQAGFGYIRELWDPEFTGPFDSRVAEVARRLGVDARPGEAGFRAAAWYEIARFIKKQAGTAVSEHEMQLLKKAFLDPESSDADFADQIAVIRGRLEQERVSHLAGREAGGFDVSRYAEPLTTTDALRSSVDKYKRAKGGGKASPDTAGMVPMHHPKFGTRWVPESRVSELERKDAVRIDQ